MVEKDVVGVARERYVLREREVFDCVLNVRVSREIDALIGYWVARFPDGHVRHYSSRGHFVRAALLYFDRVQRKLESGELKDLS